MMQSMNRQLANSNNIANYVTCKYSSHIVVFKLAKVFHYIEFTGKVSKHNNLL